MARRTADDDEDGDPKRRMDFEVDMRTYRYLEAIRRRKTHGGTVTAVVRRFIDSGVQDAIDRGYITFADGDGLG